MDKRHQWKGMWIKLEYHVSLIIHLSFIPCRLRLQHEALQKEESDQNEFIEQFILHK